jgi:hypothetical protein
LPGFQAKRLISDKSILAHIAPQVALDVSGADDAANSIISLFETGTVARYLHKLDLPGDRLTGVSEIFGGE